MSRKSVIIIHWIGLPYGVLIDVYLFQKYLGCDVAWVSCFDENRKFQKDIFQKGIVPILDRYDNFYFIETEFFAFLNAEQKKLNHRFYFLKNLDISILCDNRSYYTNLHLIDVAIARTKATEEYYKQLKNQFGYGFDIKYIKFTSLDYSKFYCSRRHFKIENPFKGNDYMVIQSSDLLIQEIPSSVMVETEYCFLSFGRKNLHIITEFWNKHREQLPKLYIKTYNNIDIGNLEECRQNEKIKIIDTFIDDKEKRELYNKCLFFINLSPEEGYGHNINEARSTGRIIMVLNREPMNEMIDNECGILMNDMYGGLYDGMNRALNLSKDEIQKKMNATKQRYMDDTQYFIEEILVPLK